MTFPKVEIFHIEGRRSERPAWLMEELGEAYELFFERGDVAGSMAMARAAHPMSLAPTVRIDGETLVESGAILELICTKYADGRMWVPAHSKDYSVHLLWMHYAEGSAAPRLLQDFMLHTQDPAGLNELAKRLLGSTTRMMDMVEAHLRERPYFGGRNFTAADIMMEFVVRNAKMWGVDMAGVYPKTGDWLDTVHQRPAYKQMLAKALPDGPLPLPEMFTSPWLADTGKGLVNR